MAFDGDTDTELDDAIDKVPSKRETRGGGNLDKLPDGEHTFTVSDGELKKGNKGFIIFELKVSVETDDGQTFSGDKSYWIKGNKGLDVQVVNGLKADLKTLGFDVDLWNKDNDRPFLGELVRVKPILAGLKFKGKKTSKAKTQPGEFFVNIYVNDRDTSDEKPEVLDAATIAELLLSGGDPTTPF